MQSRPSLDKLLVRLERLHPSDAAAVVAELSPAYRQRVLSRAGSSSIDQKQLSGPAAASITGVSAWLVAASQAEGSLTSHARAALKHHIASAHVVDSGTSAQSLLGLFELARRWRSWLAVPET